MLRVRLKTCVMIKKLVYIYIFRFYLLLNNISNDKIPQSITIPSTSELMLTIGSDVNALN